jgi:hypothetical protein
MALLDQVIECDQVMAIVNIESTLSELECLNMIASGVASACINAQSCNSVKTTVPLPLMTYRQINYDMASDQLSSCS